MKLVKRRVYEVEGRGLSGFSGKQVSRKVWLRPRELKEARHYERNMNKSLGRNEFSSKKTGRSKLRTYVRFGKGRKTSFW